MNPLDQIFDWYQTTLNSLSTTAEFLELHPSLFPVKSVFATKPLHEVKTILRDAREELHDLTIVSLVASFEQIISDHILSVVHSQVHTGTSPFERDVMERVIENAGRWRFEDMMDLFKPAVDENLVGEIKQVYQYRSWVAHGRRRKKPRSLDPRTAHQKLKAFLDQAGLFIV